MPVFHTTNSHLNEAPHSPQPPPPCGRSTSPTTRRKRKSNNLGSFPDRSKRMMIRRTDPRSILSPDENTTRQRQAIAFYEGGSCRTGQCFAITLAFPIPTSDGGQSGAGLLGSYRTNGRRRAPAGSGFRDRGAAWRVVWRIPHRRRWELGCGAEWSGADWIGTQRNIQRVFSSSSDESEQRSEHRQLCLCTLWPRHLPNLPSRRKRQRQRLREREREERESNTLCRRKQVGRLHFGGFAGLSWIN